MHVKEKGKEGSAYGRLSHVWFQLVCATYLLLKADTGRGGQESEVEREEEEEEAKGLSSLLCDVLSLGKRRKDGGRILKASKKFGASFY